jgi:hypothetical protein
MNGKTISHYRILEKLGGGAVAQALLPVLLLVSHQRTAKSGCATDSFRELFSRWRFEFGVVTQPLEVGWALPPA